jgi:hypothetical protein
VGASLAVGLAVAAFAAAWRHYGIFDFADEGLLLSQAWRAAHGQVPRVDFETGYGPLYFVVQAMVLRAGGVVGVRLVLAAVHGVAAALAYALARRLAGVAAAAAAVALQVAFFLPVSARLGTPFNVPYPAWYAGLAGIAVAGLVTAPTTGRMVAAGLLAGATAAMKPNSGVLLAAGAAVAAVVGDGRPGRAGGLGTVVLVLVALAAVVLLAPAGLGANALVLAPPVVALAVVGWRRAEPDRVVLPRLLALAVGFAVVVAPVYGPSFAMLGPARFAREVLLLGTGVAGLYALPFPWRALPVVGVALLLFVRGPVRSRRQLLLAAAALALAVVLAHGSGVDAIPTAASGREMAEQGLLALAPLVVWAALVRARADGYLLAPAAVAATGLLQLYPRPDFAHLLPLGVLVLPLLVALPRPEQVRRWALATAAIGSAVRFAPTALALVRLVAGRVETVPVGPERFVIDAAGAARLRGLAEAVADVAARTAPDATVLAFPACVAVTFFAARRPTGQYDYFFPGRPDGTQVDALLRGLEPAPPAVAVTCTGEGSQLTGAWDYYGQMAAFLDRRYRVAATYPPFEVREVQR